MGSENTPGLQFSEEVKWNEFESSRVFWGTVPYNGQLVKSCIDSWISGQYPEVIIPFRYSQHYSYKAQIIGLAYGDDQENPTLKLLLLPTKVIQHIIIKKPTSSLAAPHANPG